MLPSKPCFTPNALIMQAFVEVVSQIKRDPYLALHARYYMREVGWAVCLHTNCVLILGQ